MCRPPEQFFTFVEVTTVGGRVSTGRFGFGDGDWGRCVTSVSRKILFRD